MSIHKVIELIAQSNESWEDAAQKAVDRASETIRNIKSVYIKEMQGVVENNQITEYRVNVKITFEVEGHNI